MQTGDFKSYLQEELIERCRRNPRYSLRAFAKSLQIHHASLSQILKGNRKLTPKSCRQIGLALGLDERQIEIFVDALRKRRRSEMSEYPEKTYAILNAAEFAPVSDWYHDAILELTKFPAFRGTPEWISKKLKISLAEARVALDRLVTVGHLKKIKDKWVDVSGENTNIASINHSDFSSRKLQRQILAKAISAIDEVVPAKRDNTSIVIPIQASDLPEVKSRIKKFRRELATFLERKEATPDQLYQLSFSVFPLTDPIESKIDEEKRS